MSKKQQYRVSNWSSYNRALVNRGDLTVWFDEESIKTWHTTIKTGQKGRPKKYSNAAILCMLTLKALFNMPLRATEGLAASLIKLLNLPIKAPDYTTLSKRQGSIEIPLYKNKPTGPIHLVFDSTGLKVFGEGEWKVRQHGISKRRVWRKLHLALDADTGAILSSVFSTNDVGDNEAFPDLLASIDCEIKQASGDGAYDSYESYRLLHEHGAQITIPPRDDAKENILYKEYEHVHKRNQNIYLVNTLGKKRWKEWSGYHKRSLSETAMMRFKRSFSDKLRAIKFDNQSSEAFIKCNILNIMTKMGKPISYRI